MSETRESTTRSLVLSALLQVGVAGGIGALVLPFGVTFVVVIGWAGGSVAALVVGVLAVAVVLALLVGVASLTPEASHLTATMGGRVAWAVIVTGAGTVAWAIAYAVHTRTGSVFAFSSGLLSFALVAGLLLRWWYVQAGAAALAVVLAIALSGTLSEPATVPDELDARLAVASTERGKIFVADIPGYHRVQYQRSMEPDDPASIPPNRYLWLFAYPDNPTGDCQADPNDTTLAGFPCAVEQPGLTYTAGVDSHQYFQRRGTLRLRIVGSLAVDRAILRDAVLTARPTARPDIYTTTVDGYEASDMGSPPGTHFLPKDKTQVPMAKYVEVSESAVPHAGDCAAFQNSGAPSPYLECVEERPGLNYHRLADTHVYYAQHGSMEVRVTGGLGVDRNLLREAAVNARPATDDELMTILPPS